MSSIKEGRFGMLNFITNLVLFFAYLDGLMFKLRAEGMSIFDIILKFYPVSLLGIAAYFGLMEGVQRLVARFITKPTYNWLKKKKWRQVRNTIAFLKKRHRKNHQQRNKMMDDLTLSFGRFRKILPAVVVTLTLVLVFVLNLLPLPYLTLLSVVMVKLTGRIKLGFVIVTLGNFAKIPFVFIGIPWLYGLIR